MATSRARAGFTLVEMVMALGLLGFILIILLNIFPSAIKTVRAAEQRFHGESIAESYLEEKVQLPFESLPVGLSSGLDGQTYDQVEYHARLDVARADGDELYLRAVRVTVDWEVAGVRRQVIRERLIHRLASRTP